jgi:DNA-binding Lrp family transcriptional regulator
MQPGAMEPLDQRSESSEAARTMRLPSFQFYPGDWLRNDISGCSLEAQGLWLRMMMMMHDAEIYGELSLNNKQLPDSFIAKKCGISPRKYREILKELESFSVINRTKEGIIYSGRMKRDEAKRLQTKDRVAEHREKSNATVTQKKHDSSSSSSFSTLNTKEEREDAPAKNDFTTSEASDQLTAHLDFVRHRFNLIQLKNEREWMEAVFRCEREKVDFQKLFEFIESKRDPTKSGSVTPKMMLSDNWIASFKNPTPKKETKQNGTAYQSATDRNAANIQLADDYAAALLAEADRLDAIDAERNAALRGANSGNLETNSGVIEPPGVWS